jgi:hypothetical protein
MTNRIAGLFVIAMTAGSALIEVGCDGTVTSVEDTGDPSTSTPNLGEITSSITTASFWQSCKAYKTYSWDAGQIIYYAYSDSCQRFDGSWGGPTSWSGQCYGDVSNCNGTIVCQNHCP